MTDTYEDLEYKYKLMLGLYSDAGKEIKKLKESNEMLKKQVETDMKEIERRRAENKKLKEDVDFFYKSAKQFREENKNLQEKLSKLKEKYGDIDY